MGSSYYDDQNLIPYPVPGLLNLPESQSSLDPENLDYDVVGNDPAWISGPVLEMSRDWNAIEAVIGGTQYLRDNYQILLPQEPREDAEAHMRRVYHAVMSPFTIRIAEQAASLILRKQIQLTPRDQNGEIDPYWEDWKENVDGLGADLDTYARRVVISSLLFGHAATLVDYPNLDNIPNLQAERDLNLRPYFIHIDAKQILGFRRLNEIYPSQPISQIRINELVSEAEGSFGDRILRQVRVLENGKYCIYRRRFSNKTSGNGNGQEDTSGWIKYAEGTTSLDTIPLSVTYSNKIGELISKPPLLAIAHLNILHTQRSADLSHSLHVASQPVLVLKGWTDTESTIGLSVNKAILIPPDGDAFYVEPASSAFEAQQSFITELEEQMSSLGISTLFSQKMGSETATSKRLSRTDSDSLLSVVSKNLEASLQLAFDYAAKYIGIESPLVQISRDFDLQSLSGDQVNAYQNLWMNGAISQELLLQMLKEGEILPTVEINEEIEATQQERDMNIGLVPADETIAKEDEIVADGIGTKDRQEERNLLG
tara:strand:+ start:2822 stop:4444 length:1623 start_codon:yes stop_codon:yes gene_type:complete